MDTRHRRLALSAAALAASVVAAPAALAEDAAADPATPASAGAAAEHDEAGEDIVVTATRRRGRIRDAPAAVTLVDRDEIERSPAKTVDELLRMDPGFGLFRRSSSVVADPSALGVKLRNVGGSGISRALVLVDGIPENDPFSAWIAWRAIPRLALSRIEVVPGGGSALYGNHALGGVIQAFSRPIAPRTAELSAEYGAFDTAVLAAHAADRWGRVGAAVDGELLRSDGYVVAARCPPLGPGEQCRGPVDRPAASAHATVRGRVEARATPRLSFDLRGGYFWEDLNGGTEHTTSSMRRGELAAGAHYDADAAGALDVTLFGHTGRFSQDRAHVTADPVTGERTSEALASHQEVPTDDLGASVAWDGPALRLAGTHAVTLGTDARWVRGTTHDRGLTSERDAGGRQRLYGIYAQDLWDVTPRVGGSLAVRYDRWENLAGSRVVTPSGGTATTESFPDRSGGELSPKLGVHGRIAPWLSVRAAAYRAFRVPTLDELYRSFQAGTVVTSANERLGPERLRGAEAGVDLGAPRGPALRVTGFWNTLEDPIVNVTTGPDSRQRQNLGVARISGAEAEASWPFAHRWSARAAYTYAATRVTEAPGQPALVGKELPQSPSHVATGALSFDDPRLVTASAQLRYLGRQYEDDRNALPLGEAFLVDVFAAWHATRRLHVFLAVENLLDTTYAVGRAGVDTIGQPRFVHGGVRVDAGW